MTGASPTYRLAGILVAVVATLIACAGRVQADDFVVAHSTVLIQNLVVSQLRIFSATNATVVIRNCTVSTQLLITGMTNTSLTVVGCRVDGTTSLLGVGFGSTVRIENSTFTSNIVVGAMSAGVKRVRIFNNTIVIPTSGTISSVISFQNSGAAGTLELVGNTLSLTSSVLSYASCVHFGAGTLSGTTLLLANNTCTSVATNPACIYSQGAMSFTQRITISGNVLRATSVAGAASCIRTDDFVGATQFGLIIVNNTCVSRGLLSADGFYVVSLQTAISAALVNISANAIDCRATDTSSTGAGVALNFVLRPSTLTFLQDNALTVEATRATAAVSLGSGFAAFANFDMAGTTIAVTNTAASSSAGTGILRVVQAAAVTNLSIMLFNNTARLGGSYAPGFINFGPGSMTGSFVLVDNTLSTSLFSSIFSPALNLNNAGNVTIKCNTIGGAPLTAGVVLASLSNAPPSSPTSMACGQCAHDVLCNPTTTTSVVAINGSCYCRCRTYRYRYDALPRSAQCYGRAGANFTFSESRTKSPRISASASTSVTGSNSAARSASRSRSKKDTRTRTFYDDPLNRVLPPSNSSRVTLSPITNGIIVAIVLGSVALLTLLAILIYCCCCKDGKCICCAKKGDAAVAAAAEGVKPRGGAALGEPEPVGPCMLPDVKTATDVIAERDDIQSAHYDDVSMADMGDGELAPNRPANPYLILSLPSEASPPRDVSSREGGTRGDAQAARSFRSPQVMSPR